MLKFKMCVWASCLVLTLIAAGAAIAPSHAIADEGRELALPPPVAPAPRTTVPEALEQGRLTLPPAPPQVVPDPGLSLGNIGGAPQPGREDTIPSNQYQTPMPSGPGVTETIPIPEGSPTQGNGAGGFNSSPFGHPWYSDGHGPI
jgi:hypothetical protein